MVEPTVVAKNYAAQWFRPEIDPDELASLRSVKGWTLRRIAAHLQMPKTNVIKALGKANPPGLPRDTRKARVSRTHG